jgi:glycogen debranching enzyme
LTTGNFDGARQHILAFASTLKHGLIPNLLDSVRNPRFVICSQLVCHLT